MTIICTSTGSTKPYNIYIQYNIMYTGPTVVIVTAVVVIPR